MGEQMQYPVIAPVGEPGPDLSRRPNTRPEVSALPLNDELVLHDARGGQTYVLNASGARVWALCDGSRTLESLARAIADAYGVDDQHVLGDVRELIDALERAGLLAD